MLFNGNTRALIALLVLSTLGLALMYTLISGKDDMSNRLISIFSTVTAMIVAFFFASEEMEVIP